MQKDPAAQHGVTNAIVRTFLHSNLSIVLIVLAAVVGAAALLITPREEDPQIVVPLADIYVNFPGHSAREVEQLIATPLEKLLYQIDGVEYVYSMSREGQAVITVRYFVGQDRERSLVKLYKRIDEHLDIVPPGVTGWVVKPVEIDDVPVVTLTLTRRSEGAREQTTEAGDSADAGGRVGYAHESAGRAGLVGTAHPTSGSAPPDEFALRRVAEELVERLAAVPDTSRAYIVGGQPRTVTAYLDPHRLQAHGVSILEVQRAIAGANVTRTAGEFSRGDAVVRVEAGGAFVQAQELRNLVVGVSHDRPVMLKDVAEIVDGPREATNYVRHGWGPAAEFEAERGFPGTRIGENGEERIANNELTAAAAGDHSLFAIRYSLFSTPAVTLAVAKKKGSNAVWVARDILAAAERLKREVVPDDMELVVTRNYGLTADEKVNELVEALAVAVLIVIALLTIGLGWREALIVAVAVPVVFGLTLAVNLLLGYTINRVTLFALILALGLLVDDPIVDVENIARHFALRKRATREIVLEAVAEIRPPLISATLAVIVSFLPLFFITGMMGPYMGPMALNVPVTMLMSMLVAFTITPWMAFHVLGRRDGGTKGRKDEEEGSCDQVTEGSRDRESEPRPAESEPRPEGRGSTPTPLVRESSLAPDPAGIPLGAAAIGGGSVGGDSKSKIQNPKSKIEDGHDYDPEALKRSALYRFFHPLMAPLLRSRRRAWLFLGVIALLTVGAMGFAAFRSVPLKMLPFDNKNELLLVLDFDEGTTLERSDATVRELERYLAGQPEVTCLTSYVGVPSPIDFNGLVRHYYLRRGENVAEIRVNLVGKKHRVQQSHAIGLRMRDELTRIASSGGASLKLVESPPGPPVLSTLVAEVYGREDHAYDELIAAARTVAARLKREPGVVDVDDVIESPWKKLVFVTDKEKAALAGVTTSDIAATMQAALSGTHVGALHAPDERNPLSIELRLPRQARSSAADLARINVKGATGAMLPLSELGQWEETRVDQTIYHKNLEPVVYVFAETAGRAPAECVVDIQADQTDWATALSTLARLKQTHAAYQSYNPWLDPPSVFPDSEMAIHFSRLNPPDASGRISLDGPRPMGERNFLSAGGGTQWLVPSGIRIDFAGEGEWKITLDVFRDLGLAFAAALVGIYIVLVAQTGSFVVPLVVMLAIPLTILGVMPGFWLLNVLSGGQVGGYADPVFFTATGMIGMIALAGIVTRDAIILVDFIHLSQRRGRSLFDAIMESRVVRLRPILLTTGAAMLGAAPITIDPIFSGLAWSLIFGLFASTLFTLFVIPVTYWLLYEHRTGPQPLHVRGSSSEPTTLVVE